MELDIYKAEMIERPILGTEYHGHEEFLGAYRTDDRMIMICRHKTGALIEREFFQDYSVEESVKGLPSISTTLYANFDFEVLDGAKKDAIEDAIKRINDNKEMFEGRNITFVDLLGFAKNSVTLSSNTVQALDREKYRTLESVHKSHPFMSVYQALDKMQLERTIEELNYDQGKSL